MRGMRAAIYLLSVGAAALSLAGCGGTTSGGGGGISSTPPSPPQPPPPPPPAPAPPPPPPAAAPPSAFDDAEYRLSNGPTSARALAAYEAGATGAGVTIAVLDTGFDLDHPELAGRFHPATQDVGGSGRLLSERSFARLHGMVTALVAAGNRNGSGTQGIAFNAAVLGLRVSQPCGVDANNNSTCRDGNLAVDAASNTTLARGLDVAREQGARVANLSVSVSRFETDWPVLMEAVRRATEAGMIIVISAGNSANASPDPGILDMAAMGNGLVIIAGATDDRTVGSPNDPSNVDPRRIAEFSTRAGDGASHYMVALGTLIAVTSPDAGLGPVIELASGTSFSAPLISGAAALLAQAFPHLSGQQIVEILFRTADDLGQPGNDRIFGHGYLNLSGAFRPIGQMRLAGSMMALPPWHAGSASAAMGDADPRVSGAIALDSYARAYSTDLAHGLRRAPGAQPLGAALRTDLSTGFGRAGSLLVAVSMRENRRATAERRVAPDSLGHAGPRTLVLSGYAIGDLTSGTALALGLSESARTLQQRLTGEDAPFFLAATDPLNRMGFYARAPLSVGVRHDLGGLAVTMTGEQGWIDDTASPALVRDTRQDRYLLNAMTVTRRIGPATLSVGAMRLAEGATVLGGHLALSPGGATSWFTDIALRAGLGGGWQARAGYRRGWTAMSGRSALVAAGRLATDAWAADIERRSIFASGDRLAFRIAQPLGVRRGGYRLNVPVSYSHADGQVGYETRLYGLAPRSREIDLEAAYSMPLLGGAGLLGANAFMRRNAGHVATAPTDLGAAIRLSFGF